MSDRVSSQAGVASMRAGRVYTIGADGVPREKQPQRLPTRDDIATAIERSLITISTSDAEQAADAVLALLRGEDA